MTNFKKRNVLISFLISVLIPGLGQFYNGQLTKSIIFSLFSFFLAYFFSITELTTYIFGYYFFIVSVVLFRIYVVIDALYFSVIQKKYQLKKINTWYYYLLYTFIILFISLVFEFFKFVNVGSFNIPTTSSSPTTIVGDRVVVDFRHYKNHVPAYGDLILFKKTETENWFYRVIGLPGDEISLNHNFVTLNGIEFNYKYVKDTIYESVTVSHFLEKLPNGFVHSIYKLKNNSDSTYSTIDKFKVPENCYFLLGDNRDNAADSRFIGFVHKENIAGKLMFISFGATQQRTNTDLRKSLPF